MGLFNFFRKKSKPSKSFMRMGFGKKIYFKNVPCRYVHSYGQDDIFLRDDTNALIRFESSYVDKVILTQKLK